MIGRGARGPFALTCRRCLRVAAMPTVLAALFSLLLATLLRQDLASAGEAPGAMATWLALPVFVAALTCACSALVFWPTFADRRPGADWVTRLQRERCSNGAVIGAVLRAQVCCVRHSSRCCCRPSARPRPRMPTSSWNRPRCRRSTSQRFRASAARASRAPSCSCARWPGAGPAAAKQTRRAGRRHAPRRWRSPSCRPVVVRVPFQATAIRATRSRLLDGRCPFSFRAAQSSWSPRRHSRLGNAPLAMLLATVPTFLALAAGASAARRPRFRPC